MYEVPSRNSLNIFFMKYIVSIDKCIIVASALLVFWRLREFQVYMKMNVYI
jgi:hypothetical protein